MRKIAKLSKGLVLGCLVGVVGFGAFSATTDAAGGFGGCGRGIYCLDVWRPVICPNGQIYSNDCYAFKACQTGCVPWGGDAY